GCLRPVERAFTLAAVETRDMAARERHPRDAVAVHVHAARAVTDIRVAGCIPRHFIYFGERSVHGIGTRGETHDRPWETARRTREPNRSVAGRHDHIGVGIYAPVLGRIERLTARCICATLAVAIRVDDERGPALRARSIAGFQELLCIDPAD